MQRPFASQGSADAQQRATALGLGTSRCKPFEWFENQWLEFLSSRALRRRRPLRLGVFGANLQCDPGAAMKEDFVPRPGVCANCPHSDWRGKCSDRTWTWAVQQRPKHHPVRAVLAEANDREMRVVRRGWSAAHNVVSSFVGGAVSAPCRSQASAHFNSSLRHAKREGRLRPAGPSELQCCPEGVRQMVFARLSAAAYADAAKGNASGNALLRGQLGSAAVVGADGLGPFAKHIAPEWTRVPCQGAAEALKPLGGDPDWLVVDVEGSEFPVLWDLLDSGVRPAVIKYEIKAVRAMWPMDVELNLAHRLGEAGYVCTPRGADTWAVAADVYMEAIASCK